MLTKSKLKKTLENLPENFSIDELIEQLIFIEKVEEGLEQSRSGKTIYNEEVRKIIDKWSK